MERDEYRRMATVEQTHWWYASTRSLLSSVVGPHLRANHIRKERMFVAYEVHDADNLPNRILHRALGRLLRTTAAPDLLHLAESALTQFPDVSTAPIRDAEWSTLRFDRRTERYREAVTLARMILRDERPDLFDMKFVRDELLYYSRDENQFLHHLA